MLQSSEILWRGQSNVTLTAAIKTNAYNKNRNRSAIHLLTNRKYK